MRRVGIFGHFGGAEKFLDGQTIKTKELYNELKNRLGNDEVLYLDTFQWKKHPISFFYEVLKLFLNAQTIIFLPAHNGVKVFVPIFRFLNLVLKRKLIYIVVGGWLPALIKKNKVLKSLLEGVDIIYVETQTMYKEMANQGFENIDILKNFKSIRILKEDELIYSKDIPLKLCTFSRVTEKKGIEDIINVVLQINQKNKKITFSLDIYGQIDKSYENRFKDIMSSMDVSIQYRGEINYEESVSVIKDYFMLIFPTRFITEGIPGTIIDAYSAGVPVLASEWYSVRDIIVENKTGLIYKFEDNFDLLNKLEYCQLNIERINSMKKNCLREAMKYSPKSIVDKLIKEVENV